MQIRVQNKSNNIRKSRYDGDISQAYEGITHSLWGESWNWWWRVGDDEDQRFPSPELRTGFRSGLPMKNRRWWRLHIIKRDGTSSLIFSPNIGFYSERIRVSRASWATPPTRAHQGGGAHWFLVGSLPPPVGLGSKNYYIFQNNSPKSIFQFRELLFLHKNNTMVVLLKTASVRVSFIQNVQIRVQNKSKSVWKNRYDGDVSCPNNPR